ncbi:hypothetical protein PGT21_029664 [Puccinia graminis f. sp. tritici]|uniref:Uncharacterized protein n=1 Tax=Puccinia graminis f. sp. tritici TaxID=56615 RepID=A0A5B0QJS1_PUCGR|nr:hypothetical protein PGT21_029664 [Puccinia graminis f. sp. tritici]
MGRTSDTSLLSVTFSNTLRVGFIDRFSQQTLKKHKPSGPTVSKLVESLIERLYGWNEPESNHPPRLPLDHTRLGWGETRNTHHCPTHTDQKISWCMDSIVWRQKAMQTARWASLRLGPTEIVLASLGTTIKRPGRHLVYRLWRVGGLAIRTRPQ